MKLLVFLSLLLSGGLVGCEKSSVITDKNLGIIRRYAFEDGYFEGHKDAKNGIEISHERAESLGKVYENSGRS